MSGNVVVAINMVAFFTLIGFVIWTITTNWRRRQQLKSTTEFNNRLVDRLGSIKDFTEFLQTEGGTKFMESMTVERGSLGPRDRILRSIQAGVILTILGVGLVLISYHPLFIEVDRSYSWAGTASAIAKDDFWIAGTVIAALGVGSLASSVVAYVTAKKLGVLDSTQPPSK
jgi:hypothetical protein